MNYLLTDLNGAKSVVLPTQVMDGRVVQSYTTHETPSMSKLPKMNSVWLTAYKMGYIDSQNSNDLCQLRPLLLS